MDRKKAIKVIRDYYPSSGKDLNEALEALIPELKSEDEEMIEIIRGAIFTATMDETTKRDALAWFEKQGEHIKFLKSIQIGDEVTRNPDGVLVNLSQFKRKAEQGSQNLANSAKTCKDEPKFPCLSEKEIVCLKRILDFLREEHNSYTGEDFTNEIAVLEWLITHPVLTHSSELQLNQGWQNPAWSEEDSDYFDAIIAKLEVTQDDSLLTDNQMEFLKALKSRVQPQPKSEWGEEDEYHVKSILSTIESCKVQFPSVSESYNADITWLKSLKDRYAWKPSGEQLHYLSWVANIKLGDGVVEQEVSKHLNKLYDDLKKLKG